MKFFELSPELKEFLESLKKGEIKFFELSPELKEFLESLKKGEIKFFEFEPMPRKKDSSFDDIIMGDDFSIDPVYRSYAGSAYLDDDSFKRRHRDD
jgi:hypothetical protein